MMVRALPSRVRPTCVLFCYTLIEYTSQIIVLFYERASWDRRSSAPSSMATNKEREIARQSFPCTEGEKEKALGGGQGASSIQVLQTYTNFCVLQVSRGTGPRALEEWVTAHEAECFRPSYNSYDEDDSDEESSRRKKRKPERPVLASPHYSAYAQSLVLFARRPQHLDDLRRVFLTVHCLVKGNLEQGSRLRWENVIDGKACAIRGQSLAVAPSNTAGYITLLSVQNEYLFTNGTPRIAPRLFRKALKVMGYPVLGDAKDACSFRGESLCMSVVRLEFDASGMNESDHSVRLPPAPRLRNLLEREEQFWRKRNGKTILTHDGVAMPPEYASGTATFGGMEFHVTPAVMIPRKGTEALVERAILLYNKTHGIDRWYKGPTASILDLGTGSGCLLLTLLDRMKDAFGVGIDVSHEAILVAESNAAALGLDGSCYFARGSFADLNTEGAQDKFNLVVCNPPYHTRGGRKILDAATVLHEPDSALYIDSKDDYLIHYRDALKSLTDHLVSKAVVVFEVFRDNAEGVAKLMREVGLEDVEIGTDANGCIRTAEGIFPEKLSDESDSINYADYESD